MTLLDCWSSYFLLHIRERRSAWFKSGILFSQNMGSIYWVYLVLALCFGLFTTILSQEDSDSDTITSVYIVTLKQAPAAHYFEEELRRQSHHGFNHGSTLGRLNRLHKPRHEILPSVSRIKPLLLCCQQLYFCFFWK